MLKRSTLKCMAGWITCGLLLGMQTSAFALTYTLHTLAADGDTLPDGSTIDVIYRYQAIALNEAGQVAFYGMTAAFEDALFTNEGVVVTAGDTLPDGSTLDSEGIFWNGGIGFNTAGQVAFAGATAAGDYGVFTNDGLVVTEGDTLPDGSTIGGIHPGQGITWPSIGLNDAGQVAFCGSTAPGENVVFTSEGMAAAQGDTLPDGSTIGAIYSYGAIGLNEAGQVAFHGSMAAGVDAVFTNGGVVAVKGGTLPDGSTLGNIRQDGGIALNEAGQVAFKAAIGPQEVAVFTNDGRVATTGDTLSDGDTIDFIYPFGSIALNDAGQIAFIVAGHDGRDRVVRADPVTALVGDVDGDGDIDRDDLSLISRSRNQPASGPDDPRDVNGDGMITLADVTACIPLCSRPSCATE